MTPTYSPTEPLPLEALDSIVIRQGSHDSRENGLCALELLSWIAGEPHSDQPACACPVLTAFVVAWNDAIPDDATRTRILKPFIPRLLNTRSSEKVAERRAALAFDWLIRVHTPAWLERSAALKKHADVLRGLEPLVTTEAVRAAMPAIEAARTDAAAAWAAARDAARDAAWAAARAAASDAAWAAARDAARAAARAAAWAAAWAAARAAAGDAARDAARAAAWAAARDAAWAAARDAAWAAAGDAAWADAWAAAYKLASEALAPTVASLQASAGELLDAMIRVTDEHHV